MKNLKVAVLTTSQLRKDIWEGHTIKSSMPSQMLFMLACLGYRVIVVSTRTKFGPLDECWFPHVKEEDRHAVGNTWANSANVVPAWVERFQELGLTLPNFTFQWDPTWMDYHEEMEKQGVFIGSLSQMVELEKEMQELRKWEDQEKATRTEMGA